MILSNIYSNAYFVCFVKHDINILKRFCGITYK
nr:MAG TPA: hypothetical protein [Caudoviricetes sp.]DAL20249.1 MAG TPA_asm: hypothetical protein [Caudoviricetes sp.]DAP85292.1 MAG TPA: hypothetical protein [Caudoviricetes sp.]